MKNLNFTLPNIKTKANWEGRSLWHNSQDNWNNC